MKESLMERLRIQSISVYGMTSLAGILLALSFPLPGWSGLAWVAPGLLWLAILGVSPSLAFRAGWCGGMVHFLLSLRWLLHMPFPAGAIAGWLALSAYCGAYWGAWCWVLAQWMNKVGPDSGVNLSPNRPLLQGARRWMDSHWIHRFRTSLFAACAWVALELIRGRWMSGFPWNFLGVTQWRNPPLIQVASVAGVYGVSFILCWVSISVVSVLLMVGVRPKNRLGWLAEARVPLIVLVIVSGLGFRRVMTVGAIETRQPRIALGLIQPSIPQEILWDKSQSAARFEKIYHLSDQALAVQPDVLVWPEGCLDMEGQGPFYRMLGLVTNAPVAWILGAEDVAPDENGRDRFYNAAYLFDPQGRNTARYHKRRLVIFGEYVPLARWLPFLRWLTPIGSGFDAGIGPVRFPVMFGTDAADHPPVVASISPVICFEDIFPHGTRDHVQSDTDLLLEITNDGWFSNGSAQWQHCANASFRAVENGVPLVRCANNGITCWIDAVGRFRDRVGHGADDAYDPGFLLANVPLASIGSLRSPTTYHEYGDVFAWGCTGILMSTVLLDYIQRRSRPKVLENVPVD